MSQHEDIPDEALLEGEGALALEALASLLPGQPPAAGRRDALLAGLSVEGRLDRFAERAASMLDVDVPTAKKLLDGAARADGYEPSPFPGVKLHHISGGPKVAGSITGFVRIEAGAEFPDHDHLGEEAVLVVQGTCIDMPGGEIFRPGDVVRGVPGGRHSVIARPGPDLVYLAVLAGGLEVGGNVMLPDDPGL